MKYLMALFASAALLLTGCASNPRGGAADDNGAFWDYGSGDYPRPTSEVPRTYTPGVGPGTAAGTTVPAENGIGPTP
jgi:hypothetical protein